MFRALVFAIVCAFSLAAAAPPALAEAKADKSGKAGAEKSEIIPHLKVSHIAVPMRKDGRLLGYLFVRVRVDFTPGSDLAALRKQEPRLRHAFVRAAYQNELTDGMALNQKAAIAAFTAAARSVVGAKMVRGVSIDDARAL